jgi:hypothetical protein
LVSSINNKLNQSNLENSSRRSNDNITRLDKRHGVIAILDILGTKNKWKGKQAEPFLRKIENLYEQIDLLSGILNQYHEGKLGLKSIKVSDRKIQKQIDNKNLFEENRQMRMNISTFSDSIIIAYHARRRLINDRLLLNIFGFYLSAIFLYAFKNDIYLRGSVSIGTFFILKDAKRQLIIGPAINEAAMLFESTEWIGISTTPSASLTIEQTKEKLDKYVKLNPQYSFENFHLDSLPILNLLRKSFFIQYDLPTKNGIEKRGWALAWPLLDDNLEIYKIINQTLNFRKFQQKSIEYDTYKKFKNTKQFYESIKKPFTLKKTIV